MKKLLTGIMMFFVQVGFSAGESHPLNQVMMTHFNGAKQEDKKPLPLLKQSHFSKYRFILFFSNQCPHCVNFAPVIKAYAEAHQWTIEAISLNGQSLPEFPHATFATQAMLDVAYQGKTVTYPALFVANTETKALYPVSFGELGVAELEERMNALSEKIKRYEEGRP